MPTNFPTSVDALTNPLATDQLSSPSHASQHTNANDAIEAIETYALNGGELAYVEVTTATVSITATTEATADTVVSAGAVTFDGRAVIIEFFCSDATPDSGAAGRSMSAWLYQDGSSIGEIATLVTPAAAANRAPMLIRRRMTPTAGSHTYIIKASVSAGTGFFRNGAGGAATHMPGYIRITRT